MTQETNQKRYEDHVSPNTVVGVFEDADRGSIQGNEQYAVQVSVAIREVIEAVQAGEPRAQK